MKHGTLTMARFCHCTPCVDVQTAYVKRWRLARARGREFVVPADRALRKVEALEALGYSRRRIAEAMGTSAQSLSNSLGRKRIKVATDEKVEEVYHRFHMRVPTGDVAATLRRQKVARGFLPPLAWEDIDRGILADQVGTPERSKIYRDRLDYDLVEYMLQYHDFTPRTSVSEKIEIVRRWKAAGRSEASLCRLTGWKEGRYRHINQEAS